MSRLAASAVVLALALVTLLAPASRAADGHAGAHPDAHVAHVVAPVIDVDVDARVMGGTLMPWDAPGEAGNAFGLSVGVTLDDRWRVALAFAGILPDSRAEAAVEAFWLEGAWYGLGRFGPISPYLLVGVGLVTEDTVSVPAGAPEPVRWVVTGPEPLLMAGLGVRFGPKEGLFVSWDVRTFNATHGGVTLGAGWRF